MAAPSPLDPFAFWRDLVSQVEKRANEIADPALKSDAFAQAANKVLGASVAGKALKRELVNRYFGMLQLPTQSDIEALDVRLRAIEDRLIGISAQLDRLAGVQPRGGAPAAAMPPRTRKPPAPPEAAEAPSSLSRSRDSASAAVKGPVARDMGRSKTAGARAAAPATPGTQRKTKKARP